MIDMHTEQRQQMIREMAEYVDSLEERRERAIEALGDRYLLAKCNQVKRRDRPYGSVK